MFEVNQEDRGPNQEDRGLNQEDRGLKPDDRGPNFRRGVYSTNYVEQLLAGGRRELVEKDA